nr:hypothetical protein [Acholeplasmatales bacterium]
MISDIVKAIELTEKSIKFFGHTGNWINGYGWKERTVINRKILWDESVNTTKNKLDDYSFTLINKFFPLQSQKIKNKYNFAGILPIENNLLDINDLYTESYLLLGEGGCGKSTFLYNDYLKWYNKINKKGKKRLFKSRNTMILYFRPNDLMDLTNENIDIILKSSKEAKLKKVIFYIDGIDELGKYYDEIDSKNKLIENLVAKFRNQYGENFILKAACRKNFAKNHDIENADAFSRIRHFKIEYWNTIQLEEISSNILNFFKEVLNSKDKYSNNDKKNQYIEKIRNIEKYLIDYKNHVFDDDNKPVDKCFINSPLLLILCLLTCIFSNQDFSEMLKNKNRYNLFESFIENSSNI